MLGSRLGFTHISTGRILRQAKREGSAIGRVARAYIDKGRLVPDEVVYDLAARAIADAGWDRFVLDGFPRTLAQARWLASCLDGGGAPLDSVVLMSLSDDRVVARLSRRRVHKVTGENFHLDSKPPPESERSFIIQRKDDRPEAVRERLRIYHETTRPVADYYRRAGIMTVVDATGSFEDVHARIHGLVHAD